MRLGLLNPADKVECLDLQFRLEAFDFITILSFFMKKLYYHSLQTSHQPPLSIPKNQYQKKSRNKLQKYLLEPPSGFKCMHSGVEEPQNKSNIAVCMNSGFTD